MTDQDEGNRYIGVHYTDLIRFDAGYIMGWCDHQVVSVFEDFVVGVNDKPVGLRRLDVMVAVAMLVGIATCAASWASVEDAAVVLRRSTDFRLDFDDPHLRASLLSAGIWVSARTDLNNRRNGWEPA